MADTQEIKDLLKAIAELYRKMATIENAVLGIEGTNGILRKLCEHEERLDEMEKRWLKLAGIWAAVSAIGAAVGVNFLSKFNIF